MKIKELEMYEKCYKKLFGRMLKKGKKIKNQNIYIYIKEEIKKKTETNPF
jgi:ribosomal protein S7